jgi:hypothetical protein
MTHLVGRRPKSSLESRALEGSVAGFDVEVSGHIVLDYGWLQRIQFILVAFALGKHH